jgi:hypothetical protein
MEYQKIFLDIIARYLPEGTKLVDFISDLIHLGKEASYRRIRCEVEFSLSEVVIIAKKLNINLTSLILREGGDKVVFNLRFIEETNATLSYIKKIKANLNILEGFRTEDSCDFYSVNSSIPDEFICDLPNLTKLKLLKIQFDNDNTEPSPFNRLDIHNTLKEIQQQYKKELGALNIIYILEPNLLLPTVSDILFFHELNLISAEEKKYLKNELLLILDIINDIACSGKYNNREVSLYISHVTFNLSHGFIQSKGLEASIIDLRTPNSLLSFDSKMYQTHVKWVNKIKKYSSFISKTGEITKASFLKKQKAIIEQL